MPSPKQVIEKIRKQRFGEGLSYEGLSEDHIVALQDKEKVLQDASQLVTEIYTRSPHFILELIQNADDNTYETSVKPKVKFTIRSNELIVQNNEKGFNEKNAWALCGIGETTKTRALGYIGEKGIGFKSVFMISDKPQIYSSGFQFGFKRDEQNPVSIIIPHWIDEVPESVDPGLTNIVLPLKPEAESDAGQHVSQIDPSLLLFLRKIRTIEIEDEDEHKLEIVERHDHGAEVEITHGSKTSRWRVVRKGLERPVQLVEDRRKDIHETEVVLAFPIGEDGTADASAEQSVFAFLPVREYGFKFIIQADFILPVGREDIIRDNEWNKWLRDSVSAAFLEAVQQFRADEKLRSTFYNFIPLDEVKDRFFSPVVTQIFTALRSTECILSESNEWRRPSEVLMADEGIRKLVSNRDLKTLLGKEYVSTEVAARKEILRKLGVKQFSIREMMRCLRKREWVKKQSGSWFARLYRYLSKQDLSEDVVTRLRRLRIVRLENKKLASLADGAIFLSLHKGRKQYGFESELRIVDRNIIKAISRHQKKEKHRRISEFLTELGVQAPSPYEIIENHILPAYEHDEWRDKDSAVLLGHIKYIKDNMDSYEKESDAKLNASRARWQRKQDPLGRLKKSLLIRIDETSDGGEWYLHPAKTYLSRLYGNPNDLETLLDDIQVYFVHPCYVEDILKDFERRIDRVKGKLAGKSKEWKKRHKEAVKAIRAQIRKLTKQRDSEVRGWRDFSVRIGVWEGLMVEKDPDSEIHEGPGYARNAVTYNRIERWRKVETIWKDEYWSKTEWHYYIGDDWVSEDFERIVERLDDLDGEERIAVATKLCELMARSWAKYKEYQSCNYYYRSYGERGWSKGTTRSTFLLRLIETSWLPTNQNTLVKPSELFLDKPEIREVLGDTVPYLAVRIRNQDLAEALRINTSANVDNVLEYLKVLGEKCDERTKFGNIYHFLNKRFEEDEDKIRDAFSENALIFIPNRKERLFASHQVLWSDLSDVFGENRAYLQKHYPRLKYFFVERLGISEKPSPKDYADVLVDLCRKDETTSKDEQVVLKIYEELDHQLDPSNVETPISEEKWWDDFISKRIFLVDHGDFWINDGDIFIEDHPELSRLFEAREEIAFLRLPTGYHPDRIRFFVRATRLRYLSEAVRVVPDFDESSCSKLPELTKQVLDFIPYVMRYLYWKENREYERLKAADFFQHFANFQAYAADELHVKFAIETYDDRIITAVGPKACLLHKNRLYISRGFEGDTDRIAIELSQLFGDIKGFDDFVLCLFEKQTADKIENLMSAKGIRELPKSEEDRLDILALAPPEGRDESLEAWVPESSPDESEIDIEDYEPEDVLAGVVTGEGDDEGHKEGGVGRGNGTERDDIGSTAGDEEDSRYKHAKAIGRWGEEYALKSLREEASERHRDAEVVETDDGFVAVRDGKTLVEVVWLNKYGDRGVGHDIELIERETKYYIEVKSTKLEQKDWFVVTRDQWRLMQQHGDRFSIYRIYGAGTENPRVVRIKDPAGLWRKGAIDAHPVRIRI